MRFDDISEGKVIASVPVGRFVVPLERLKLYLEHYGLTTDKDSICVEVKRLRRRTTSVSDDFIEFVEVEVTNKGGPKVDVRVQLKRISRGSIAIREFVEVELVDNGDSSIDGKVLCIGFDDLVQVG